MTTGDVDFERAWNQLREEDAALTAPPRVAHAVRREWRARQEGPRTAPRSTGAPHLHPPGGRTARRAALVLAAAAVAAVVAASVTHEPRPAPESRRAAATSAAEPRPASFAAPAAAPEPSVGTAREGAAAPMAPSPGAAAQSRSSAVLAPAPVFDAEPLDVVRVRVPRRTLDAYGLWLPDLAGDGLVEIDLIVGSDGLPLGVGRIRATGP